MNPDDRLDLFKTIIDRLEAVDYRLSKSDAKVQRNSLLLRIGIALIVLGVGLVVLFGLLVLSQRKQVQILRNCTTPGKTHKCYNENLASTQSRADERTRIEQQIADNAKRDLLQGLKPTTTTSSHAPLPRSSDAPHRSSTTTVRAMPPASTTSSSSTTTTRPPAPPSTLIPPVCIPGISCVPLSVESLTNPNTGLAQFNQATLPTHTTRGRKYRERNGSHVPGRGHQVRLGQ